MDSYSRKILSWRVEPMISAQARIETIRETMVDFPSESIRLITDGGPENDNDSVKSFIAKNRADIQHQIALRNIIQSNSMIEATYKTLKYRCLYKRKIPNGSQLKKEKQLVQF